MTTTAEAARNAPVESRPCEATKPPNRPGNLDGATFWPTPHRRPAHREFDFEVGELFCGHGGMSNGFESIRTGKRGFTSVWGSNHNPYKCGLFAENHRWADVSVADTVNEEDPGFRDPRTLPRVRVLLAGVACTSFSSSNAKRAWRRRNQATLFDLEDEASDEEYRRRLTKSERERSTGMAVLFYADHHRPDCILVECTTEFLSWGDQHPSGISAGDGSTFKWWLRRFDSIGYQHDTQFLNAMFFGPPQSRDRVFIAFWRKSMRTPDVTFRPNGICPQCEIEVACVQRVKSIPPSCVVRYGTQYDYRCPRCSSRVEPYRLGAISVLNLNDPGVRIGDRADAGLPPLKPSGSARVEQTIRMFRRYPAYILPAKSQWGSARSVLDPMTTQTGQHDKMIVSDQVRFGGQVQMAGNTYQHPGSTCRTRSLDEPFPAQTATQATAIAGVGVSVYRNQPPSNAADPFPTQGSRESFAVVNAGVVPFRANTLPTGPEQPMPTFTAQQRPGIVMAGTIKTHGNVDEAKYRAKPIGDPFGAFTASGGHQVVTTGPKAIATLKNNGVAGDTRPAPISDPFGAFVAKNNTSIIMTDLSDFDPDAQAEIDEYLANLKVEDCWLRMANELHEIAPACGVVPRELGGDYVLFGSKRDIVDALGNGVVPQIGQFYAERFLDVLDEDDGEFTESDRIYSFPMQGGAA